MKRAIHCKTQEQWNHVLEVFEKKGWRWSDGTIPSNNNYWCQEPSLCVEYCNEFTYNDIDWYNNGNYQILSYKEFLEEEGLWKLPEKWYVKVTNNNLSFFKSLPNYQRFILGDWSSITGLNTAIDTSNISESYTEITFDQFKKYVLNQKTETMEKKFVKVVNVGKDYSTHPKAKEYGLVNYHYWKNLPRAKNGDILVIVKEVIVNVNEPSYILKDKNGIEYLIGKDGVVDCGEKEIIGYKLKEECKQYEGSAKIITGYSNWNYVSGKYGNSEDYFIKEGAACYVSLKDAGVLDLWFEPVYKEDKFKAGDYVHWSGIRPTYGIIKGVNSHDDGEENYILEKTNVEGIYDSCHVSHLRLVTKEEYEKSFTPNIIVNGYKGAFFDWGVKFGCAEIQKEIFISLSKHIGHTYVYTNREVESVTIGKGTFTKYQIREIAEYYLNK